MNNLISMVSQIPATGNTEQQTYITILIIAGVLVIGAVIAGIFTKKKK